MKRRGTCITFKNTHRHTQQLDKSGMMKENISVELGVTEKKWVKKGKRERAREEHNENNTAKAKRKQRRRNKLCGVMGNLVRFPLTLNTDHCNSGWTVTYSSSLITMPNLLCCTVSLECLTASQNQVGRARSEALSSSVQQGAVQLGLSEAVLAGEPQGTKFLVLLLMLGGRGALGNSLWGGAVP